MREVLKSHVNYVVADTDRWEQSAAYAIDRHPITAAFVKNAGLGFYIPYLHNGQKHDYTPDFIIKLNVESPAFLILEVKGWDPLEEVKSAAAMRWCAAVNADGAFGHWRYRIAKRTSDVQTILDEVAQLALASDAG